MEKATVVRRVGLSTAIAAVWMCFTPVTLGGQDVSPTVATPVATVEETEAENQETAVTTVVVPVGTTARTERLKAHIREQRVVSAEPSAAASSMRTSAQAEKAKAPVVMVESEPAETPNAEVSEEDPFANLDAQRAAIAQAQQAEAERAERERIRKINSDARAAIIAAQQREYEEFKKEWVDPIPEPEPESIPSYEEEDDLEEIEDETEFDTVSVSENSVAS